MNYKIITAAMFFALIASATNVQFASADSETARGMPTAPTGNIHRNAAEPLAKPGQPYGYVGPTRDGGVQGGFAATTNNGTGIFGQAKVPQTGDPSVGAGVSKSINNNGTRVGAEFRTGPQGPTATGGISVPFNLQ